MEIIWHGHSFFEIQSKKIKIAIDPFDEKIGLLPPKIKADILLISHNHYDHNNKKIISGDYFLIEGPGEYEIKGIFIEGVESFHDEKGGKERGKNTIYKIETEGFKICHLGDFGQKELTNGQKEKLENLDILMIPVGGIFTISAKEAIKIVQELEPKIVIPMHYLLPKLKIKLDPPEKFLKLMGIKALKPLEKLKLKKGEKLSEETKVILLKPLK
jgi:L-ascorbate metabolism protein UlaG (beta-lactamase superfamily)